MIGTVMSDTLKRDQPAKSFAQMTHDIPADKLEKLREILAELNHGEDTDAGKPAS
jgi:hypothetical protein